METASGDTQTRDEANIYVEELDMYVTATFIRAIALPLRSVGKLARDHAIVFSWTGMRPILTKPDGTVAECGTGPKVRILASML